MAQIQAVGIRPGFFIQQGIQQPENHLIGLFLRNDQVLLLQILPDGAQRLGQENGQGSNKLRVQPQHDPFDILRLPV